MPTELFIGSKLLQSITYAFSLSVLVSETLALNRGNFEKSQTTLHGFLRMIIGVSWEDNVIADLKIPKREREQDKKQWKGKAKDERCVCFAPYFEWISVASVSSLKH
jgi:hypothetical protein